MINGYGLTLESDVHGAFAGVESVTVGGLEVSFDEIATLEAHRTGTASFTNGSTAVVGTASGWTADMAGRRIRLDADGDEYAIASVTDATHLTLAAAFAGSTGSGAYTILPTRVVENIPLAVRESPMEVTLTYSQTLYETLRGAAKDRTESEWTLTDVESSVHVGEGRVRSVGGMTLGAEGHATFTVSLQPTTCWAFTAGA